MNTDSSAPTSDAQPKSMPEHSCATVAQALEIVHDGRFTLLDKHEDKYAFILRSDPATLFRSDPAPVIKQMQDMLAETLRLRQLLLAENTFVFENHEKAVVYAGHRFKFRSYESAVEFEKAARNDYNSKVESLQAEQERKWLAILSSFLPTGSSVTWAG